MKFRSFRLEIEVKALKPARIVPELFCFQRDPGQTRRVTREEFDQLIGKLEEVSRRHPRLYTTRIVGLVALAYGYLGLILAGSLIVSALMIVMVFYAPGTIKIGLVGLIAFGGVFWAVLRGLWVKLEAPKGQIVTEMRPMPPVGCAARF